MKVNLEDTQMNMQCRLIQELMFYEFKLGNNTAKATQNICYVKGWFYGISTFVGYLTPNPFLCK